MCKEHLGVALALKVPVFFLVTKVGIVLQNLAQLATRHMLLQQLLHPGFILIMSRDPGMCDID